MKMLAQALVFGDRTLITSAAATLRAWSVWDETHGLSASSGGQRDREGIADLLPAQRGRASAERNAELGLTSSRNRVFPDARMILRGLPGYRWAVVTSAQRSATLARMRNAGLRAPLIIAADDVTRGQPHPESYLLAAELLGLPPAGCVVIEDAPAGLCAAQAAGMRTIAVTTTHPRERLTADLVTDSLAAIQVTPVSTQLVLNISGEFPVG